jgi:O-antigen/teichoic acid export membrane protein
VRLYCLASLALFAASLTYPILVAAEHVRDTLVSSLISLPPSLLVIFVASFFGVEAVTASALVTLPFQASVAIYFVSRRLRFSLWEFARAMRKSAFVGLCSGLSAAAGARICEFAHCGPFAVIVVSCMLAAATWLIALILVGHPLFSALGDIAQGLKFVSLRSLGRRPADQHQV